MGSFFDMLAGFGAAKTYTALALQRISRHFRCLRDAISGQIRITRRNLGEQDTSPNGLGGGLSRLSSVDQQIRQQRAFQQFGGVRHAWRPQRGLPESSVSILRTWLFEHFLHPYVPVPHFSLFSCLSLKKFESTKSFLISHLSVIQRIQRKSC